MNPNKLTDIDLLPLFKLLEKRRKAKWRLFSMYLLVGLFLLISFIPFVASMYFSYLGDWVLAWSLFGVLLATYALMYGMHLAIERFKTSHSDLLNLD